MINKTIEASDHLKKARLNGSTEVSIRPNTTFVVKNAGAMNSIIYAKGVGLFIRRKSVRV